MDNLQRWSKIFWSYQTEVDLSFDFRPKSLKMLGKWKAAPSFHCIVSFHSDVIKFKNFKCLKCFLNIKMWNFWYYVSNLFWPVHWCYIKMVVTYEALQIETLLPNNLIVCNTTSKISTSYYFSRLDLKNMKTKPSKVLKFNDIIFKTTKCLFNLGL